MFKWYVADFETTSYKYYKDNGYTKVWLYSICDSDANIVNYGTNIESFFYWLENNTNSIIYFHNLKFDGSFILNYLLNNNYEYKDKLLYRDKKGFSALIGEEGQYYSLTINFCACKQVKIYDSLKLIPLKVEEIAKAFKLPINKLKIDYEDYEINQEKLNYVFNDVKIVSYAIRYFKENNFNSMTIGSCSYNDFKSKLKNFNQLFPELEDKFINEYREAYRGGRSQVNPIYENEILCNVKRYDLNSMYPYVISRYPMPYGNPIKQKEIGLKEFELYKIEIDFTLKIGHLPTLLKSQSMYNAKGDTYYINSDSIEVIYITSIDYKLLCKHYDIHYIKFLEIYGFNTSKYMFREWVDNYYDLKNSNTGGLKLLYKLILNNLYGKFGSKHKGKKRIPCIKDNILSLSLGPEEELKKYFLCVAMAVTSYSHEIIDNAILVTGYNNFVYCDTDSVHTLGELPIELVDNKEIGKFKLEGVEIKSKYIRQKCYIYKENKENYNITCSGMTDGIKEYLITKYDDNIFDVFKVGLKVDKESIGIKDEQLKKRPLQVKGGVVLVPVPFSIK